MILDDKTVKQILVQEHYLSTDDVSRAEANAKLGRMTIADYVIAENILTKDLLGQAIAESFNMPYADLNSNVPSQEQMLRIPEEIARRCRVVLFGVTKNSVTVATDTPTQPGLEKQLKTLFPKQKILLSFSLPEDIEAVLIKYQKSLETRFSKIIADKQRIAPELLEEILQDAYALHASDIHFDPQGQDILIRFRIDGLLREAGRIPKEHYTNILNRIKVLSRLRIDEHFSAQDGSMRIEDQQGQFDLRTSIVPTIEGEKVALRLLAAHVQSLTLEDLGLSARDQQMLSEMVKKPFGMILVTGPTGSGKTTTLYALLKLLERSEINITTIEDPVEYRLAGVNQIQVSTQKELTFAKGLRSIVRQDPDVILVGEIRDQETAEIAVNAALTGHLLLSTFHATDAATGIPRLLDMGVERFLLASTLEVLIAQRLIRRICDVCRYSTTFTMPELEKRFPWAKRYFSGKRITLYAGKGCQACGQSGYHGRTAIFEVIAVTNALKELILQHPSALQVATVAGKQGFHSLFEDGIEKVQNGITTIEELVRNAEPPHVEDGHGKK